MGGAAAARSGRKVSRGSNRVPAGNGRTRKIPPAVSPLRHTDSADQVRCKRDQLLSDLPDERKTAGGPGLLAAVAGRLAEDSGRVGDEDGKEERSAEGSCRKRPSELDGRRPGCGSKRQGARFRSKSHAGGAGEELLQALAIFSVERVIDVGAEIEGKFLFRELQLAGGFAADFPKMFQSKGQRCGKIGHQFRCGHFGTGSPDR